MKQQHSLPHWHRGVHALHFGAVSGLMSVTFMAAFVLQVVSPMWVQPADAAVTSFSSGSFWNAATPSYTALHPNSGALAADIARQVAQYGSGVTSEEGAAVYTAEPDTPLVTVVPWDCGVSSSAALAAQWTGVPIPFYATPGGSSNHKMIVRSYSTNEVWEFGHMRNVSGQWQACTGGKITTASDGIFPAPYGVSSSGLALLGGQLSVEDVTSGFINHMIGLQLPQTNGHIWPASQGGGSYSGTPAMGQRLRLDPAIDVQSLGLTPLGTRIAKAAQTYGFVVWNGGPRVSIMAESPVSYTTRGLPNPYQSSGLTSALQNFPWHKLQALPTETQQTAKIPTITQFTVSQSTVRQDNKVTFSWRAENVNRCGISGVSDTLPALGSIQSGALRSSGVFTLRCGGPDGMASSQLQINVIAAGSNDPLPTLDPQVIIDQPYTGWANILPDLMSADAAQNVYKVAYFNGEDFVTETVRPPFALNTNRLQNGKYAVAAQVYFKDGTSQRKAIGITVNNSAEYLFATTQSGIIKAPHSIPLLWGVVGGLIALAIMAVGTLWGWHRAHLHWN